MNSDKNDTTGKKQPINEVYFANAKTLLVEECVVCGGTHRHGARDPAVARGEPSHRVSHCGDLSASNYYIRLAEDADPPDRYFQWVLGKNHDPAVRAPCGGGEA